MSELKKFVSVLLLQFLLLSSAYGGIIQLGGSSGKPNNLVESIRQLAADVKEIKEANAVIVDEIIQLNEKFDAFDEKIEKAESLETGSILVAGNVFESEKQEDAIDNAVNASSAQKVNVKSASVTGDAAAMGSIEDEHVSGDVDGSEESDEFSGISLGGDFIGSGFTGSGEPAPDKQEDLIPGDGDQSGEGASGSVMISGISEVDEKENEFLPLDNHQISSLLQGEGTGSGEEETGSGDEDTGSGEEENGSGEYTGSEEEISSGDLPGVAVISISTNQTESSHQGNETKITIATEEDEDRFGLPSAGDDDDDLFEKVIMAGNDTEEITGSSREELPGHNITAEGYTPEPAWMSTPAPEPELVPGQMSEEMKWNVLNYHNLIRRGEYSSNMKYLHWDETLADYARDWALACGWGHGQPDRNDAEWSNDFIGQNLYFKTKFYDPIMGISRWHEEVKYYNYTDRTCEEGEVCGHYTQLVWAGTEKVGCAFHKCDVLVDLHTGKQAKNAYYLVCNYGQGGNVHGMKPYKFGPMCSECEGNVFWCDNGLCRDCEADGVSCECSEDGCTHGRPDPDTCTCTLCDFGYQGDRCDEPCRNLSPNCDTARGWKEKHCWGRNAGTIQYNCPLMCGLCEAPADGVLPIVPPRDPREDMKTIFPLWVEETAIDFEDHMGRVHLAGPLFTPEDKAIQKLPCHVGAVLHIIPPLPYVQGVQITLSMVNPSGWVFDLGDSECHIGDGIHCSNNTSVSGTAELQMYGSDITGYRSNSSDNFTSIHNRAHGSYDMVIRISRNYLGVSVGDSVLHSQCSNQTFEFNDMWLGLNRVLSDDYTEAGRHGTGVCQMQLKWYRDAFEPCAP